MTDQSFSLITFYQGWKNYQCSLVEIIAPLSFSQLASPVAPHHWTIGMVAQHMVSDRVWWFHGWLGQGSADLAPIIHWNPGDEEEQTTHDATELVAAFESTWKMIEDALAHWIPTDLSYVVPQPAFLSEGERKVFVNLTRQWIIWHVLEHEIHHGGELSLALGGLGLPGIYGNA